MVELSINPGMLQSLILKTRGVMAHIGHVSDDEGNLADDEGVDGFRSENHDMSADELIIRIDDLEPDQQAELVALLWIGRGDMEPGEWSDAVQQAIELQSGSTATYLLTHPHLAEHWDNAVDRLFGGTAVVENGEF